MKYFWACDQVKSGEFAVFWKRPGIGLVCPYPDHLAWMEYHPHCFADICLQPHPVK